MSLDYAYVNHDKRQHYFCGMLGWRSDFAAIGCGPGARALGILLSDRGKWSRDRISVVSDTSAELSDLTAASVDIGVDVTLMLLDVDGTEWIDSQLETSTEAFRRMCAIAIQLRRSDVLDMLNNRFGVGNWQRRYKAETDQSFDPWQIRLSEALKRGIETLA